VARVTIGGRSYEVEVRGNIVVVDGHEIPVQRRQEQGYVQVTAGGVPYRIQVPPEGERHSGIEVAVDYRPFTVEWEGRLGGGPAQRPAARDASPRPVGRPGAKGGITAQMTGRVISVKVKPGDKVRAGDVLLLLEAMKMENEIKAPADGVVKEVLVADGARVSEGETLVVIE
jgi:biotin carboxyl carrier protein